MKKNSRNAGMKAIHDIGIRHIKRERIYKPMPLHITIKLKRNHLQNKIILKSLKRAICIARSHGLKIVHFTLEFNHIHLYVECSSNKILTKAMKSFGVSMAKKINKSIGQIRAINP